MEWTFRAITSFPVPLSPVSRIVLSLLATRGRIRLISRTAACSPVWDGPREKFLGEDPVGLPQPEVLDGPLDDDQEPRPVHGLLEVVVCPFFMASTAVWIVP